MGLKSKEKIHPFFLWKEWMEWIWICYQAKAAATSFTMVFSAA